MGVAYDQAGVQAAMKALSLSPAGQEVRRDGFWDLGFGILVEVLGSEPLPCLATHSRHLQPRV